MNFVTKATPIHFIDNKHHIKSLKQVYLHKSYRVYITLYHVTGY